MRLCISALLLRRVLSLEKISHGSRGFASLSTNPLIYDSHNLVLVEAKASSRTAILSRPSSLNALNHSMVARLHKLYKDWEEDPSVGFVAIKGEGRAFSAGGDLVALYNLIKQGNLEECKQLFWDTYSFIYFLGTYMKPHVALLNGITMGTGAGISIPGTFRVATDKTIFATPETLIGFHPDAGASFHLSHLPGYMGEYLALTGENLNGAEMVSCGLATHFSSFTWPQFHHIICLQKLPLVEEQLGKLATDDPSVVGNSLPNQGDMVGPDHTSVIHRTKIVDKCFSHDTVEEITECLEMEASRTNDPWSISTLKKLKEASPLSLKVALRSIREGRFQTLDQCLIREYRMTLQGVSGQITGDFREGVRARVVDKDFTPKWDPPRLEHVSEDMVDEYFAPLSALEPQLELPTNQRQPFT